MSYDYDIAYKLLQKDPVMKQIIKVTGRLNPERRQRDIYGSLLRSVTGQQLSVKAATTIHNRFLDLFPERNPEPSKVLKLSIEKLRSVGLSGQKSSYVISVAEHAIRGELEFKNIIKLDDDQLIKQLTAIKGIGVWSAQMVMMFALQRPDVFPVGDLGIQISMKSQYNIKAEGKALHKKMEQIAEAWQPYRTLASRHLWADRDGGK
ncbi:MAG: DNA-3-methyladenine glycosylase family protein [Bacteroidota bacterium]|jgi:DNA-3-methyladenine glycosylase II